MTTLTPEQWDEAWWNRQTLSQIALLHDRDNDPCGQSFPCDTYRIVTHDGTATAEPGERRLGFVDSDPNNPIWPGEDDQMTADHPWAIAHEGIAGINAVAPVADEGLDVERLTEAMEATYQEIAPGSKRVGLYATDADKIASHYARLAADTEPEEGA